MLVVNSSEGFIWKVLLHIRVNLALDELLCQALTWMHPSWLRLLATSVASYALQQPTIAATPSPRAASAIIEIQLGLEQVLEVGQITQARSVAGRHPARHRPQGNLGLPVQ